MDMSYRSLALSAAALTALATASALDAQAFPGFGGIEGRVGMVSPENANFGFSASADLDLGYVGSPTLRTIIGANYFIADVDRANITGSMNVIGGRVGLRLDPLGGARLSPFLIATVNGHNVNADVDDEPLQETLSGFNVGAALGGGIGYALDDAHRTVVTLEGRRVFINNIGHWGAEIGVRIVPRGRDAYRPVIRYRDPYLRGEDVRTAAEIERVRAERERLEAERIRTDQTRMTEQERLRAEQERMARMTDEERARAQREAAEQRARADTLEEQRRQEAEARAAAEQEAQRARAEAEAAERRVREVEERLYQSLLDLDRLLTNITEIRETERGLSIVLGQGLFAVGQHTLSPRARDEVGRIAAVLAQYPDRRIAVEGHTDLTGSEALNQRLSEQRASSVHAALIANGIDPARVEMSGYGQNRPIADNATAAGRAQNRRVEIVIIGAQRPAATVTQE
ncbi:MAG: OmpA family protein [Gemmatimonadetes bacterium]|nr:OmpA family protein [Gemmatimonadota bacterium]